MKYVSKDGHVFDSHRDDYVFTREPLVILPGLSYYRIDDEDVAEERFRAELEAAMK